MQNQLICAVHALVVREIILLCEKSCTDYNMLKRNRYDQDEESNHLKTCFTTF